MRSLLSCLPGTCIFLATSLVIMTMASSFAAVPQLINYQGKLTKASGAPLDTTIQMVFTIYADSNGTTFLWTETQSSVKAEKGVFNILLGSLDSIPYSVFDGNIRYLGVKIGDDPEITPRRPMMSVGYAYKSFKADTANYALRSNTADTAYVVVGPPDLTGMNFNCLNTSSVSVSGSGYFCLATGHCKWYGGIPCGSAFVTIQISIDGIDHTYTFESPASSTVGGQDLEGTVSAGLWKFNSSLGVNISFGWYPPQNCSIETSTASYSISWWK